MATNSREFRYSDKLANAGKRRELWSKRLFRWRDQAEECEDAFFLAR